MSKNSTGFVYKIWTYRFEHNIGGFRLRVLGEPDFLVTPSLFPRIGTPELAAVS